MIDLTKKHERIKLWTDALRSGEYKQGTRRLQNEDGSFCCLGVLCDLFRKETGEDEWTPTEGDRCHDFMGACATLPEAVQDWAGLGSNNPTMSNGRSLAAINDKGASFTEIADLIERDLA